MNINKNFVNNNKIIKIMRSVKCDNLQCYRVALHNSVVLTIIIVIKDLFVQNKMGTVISSI